MKILSIHNFSRDLNGEDIYFNSLNTLLKRKNYGVIYYTTSNLQIKDKFSDLLKIAGRMYFNLQIAKELTQIIRVNMPDIAHVHNIFPLLSPSVYRVCHDNKIPVVQTIHNYRMVCPGSFLFRKGKTCELCPRKNNLSPSVLYGCYHSSKLSSLIFGTSFSFHLFLGSFGFVDKYIFPSEYVKDYLLSRLSITKSKTHVIPYFVSVFKSANRRKYTQDYFLFAGRLSEEKGIMELLNIFKTLSALKLVVIGDGLLKVKVDQYKKYKNIIIHNFMPREKVFEYMKNAIATVIPSLWYETGPMVMIESFASGTPVIVPEYGTFKYAVKDGKTGIFYRQYDFEDLKNKILWANKNQDKMEIMGDKARKEYERKYTPEIHYEKLLEVYRDLI